MKGPKKRLYNIKAKLPFINLERNRFIATSPPATYHCHSPKPQLVLRMRTLRSSSSRKKIAHLSPSAVSPPPITSSPIIATSRSPDCTRSRRIIGRVGPLSRNAAEEGKESPESKMPLSQALSRLQVSEKRETRIEWREGELLGHGSEGQVIKAFNLVTGGQFAVKKLPIEEQSQAEKLNQLSLEINILKELNHANIVKYLGSEIRNNYCCIYLEYMPGGSIKDLLSKTEPMSEAMAKRYIRQMLQGLKYLHAQGIIHRDLKGANLLLDSMGTLKISDFGGSKKYQNSAESGTHKTIRGSLSWTAPEIIKTTGHGRKADIWSVGCIFIEMLTASPPWSEVTDYIQVLMKLLTSEETPGVPETVSPEARDFIDQCLQREPCKRPAIEALLQHPFLSVNTG